MTRHRISLNVGRLLVVEIRRARFAITVAKSAVASMAAVAGLPERVETESFATAPGLQLCRLSAKDLPSALPYLLAGLDEGVREAARTARRALGVVHAPGVLEYANQELGRVLPRPAGPLGGSVVPEAVAVSTPTAGFRATELDLASLISDVANGYTGLPDIQRPFVWTSAKVRDLFDSMYRGYPVGYLLFWETNTAQQATRVIGVNDKAYKTPRRLIVDGQQRLTSLFAVMRGVEVLDEDYRAIKIEIAFRPRDGRFEVADAAIRNDPEFIPSISTLLSDDRGSYALIRDFLSRLRQRRNLIDRDQQIIGRNLERLFSLKQYRFSVLEISSELDEEAVADIFVRINSEGVKLNQADFILTLLSVIWEEGRAELEKFSRDALRPPTRHGAPSPFNHLVAPSPDQLLRVSVALAFNRARMKSVYHLLRGKDPDSGAFIVERRSENLRLLQGAQQLALDLDHWHRFLSCTTAAGFRLREQVSSQNALLTAYALYIRGLTSARVSPVELDRLVGRWLWMAILTSRFSTSPETAMEDDLTSVAGIEEAARFVDALERTISAALTNDYWNITLPIELETSSPRAAGWVTFVAAQLRLDAPVLFSDKKLWAILDPLMRGKRRQFEAHHLFPKAWLVAQGIADRRGVNQIANLAFLEWPANARAGSRGPDKYGPELREHISEAAWERMCRLHALPAEWHTMDYPQFLSARRPLMAQLIRRGFSTLSAQSDGVVQDEVSGSDAENGVWQQIARLERELRATLRRLATGHWGTAADERIRRILGPDALSTLERHREKYAAQYKFTPARHGNELLDFLYLGQLIDIMKNNEVWPMFNSTFRDKRQLEDLIAAIIPVRNDAAHFRTVPSRELERCRIAVGDLAVLIARI